MPRPYLNVRLAKDSEARQVGNLVDSHLSEEAQFIWEKVYPYWLVVEDDKEMIACCQVMVGLLKDQVTLI